jgi:predicted TIM-barrel fold metal-dependent hydrolase
MLKIDVFPHILPRPFYDRLMEVAPSGGLMVKRVQNIPVMIDIDRRFEIMDRHEGYRQVLTLAAPPLENVAGPDLSPELAKLANEEMAKLVEKYPDRFPGFVASLPMNNPDESMKEIDRAINDLGATGVQVFTNVNGEPLDKPEYIQLFERMAGLDLPVWIHPARTAAFPDYPGEERSKYDLWWAFGWPYETAVAMARLLFSGLLDRHPTAAAETADRLFPHVLWRHGVVRAGPRGRVRARLLRRRPRAVRH